MKKSLREKKRSVSYKPLVRHKIKSKIEDFFLSLADFSNVEVLFSAQSGEISIDALRIHPPTNAHDNDEKKRARVRFRSFSR